MKKAGVPTVPGSEGIIRSDEEAVEVVKHIGFPVMIKATAGGGGRGMRLAKTQDEFLPLLKQAQQEAQAAFGNGAVYIERYVQVRLCCGAVGTVARCNCPGWDGICPRQPKCLSPPPPKRRTPATSSSRSWPTSTAT